MEGGRYSNSNRALGKGKKKSGEMTEGRGGRKEIVSAALG
jgi:hypothetical protein